MVCYLYNQFCVRQSRTKEQINETQHKPQQKGLIKKQLNQKN